jgi:radical SAM/Cys-rich protein
VSTDTPTTPSFARHLDALGEAAPARGVVTTLQVNIGLRCNLACQHCHVESGPLRSERLSRSDCDRVLDLLERNPQVETLDLTGGAPELHEHFRHVVGSARALGRRVVDRCNLTILREPGQEDTAAFLAWHEVDIVASLPCYSPQNVEAQRGRGVFGASIEALRLLNQHGYGQGDPKRRLDLVYNPAGPFLPPAESELEAEYRERLDADFGIVFDGLLTLTNMPIKRFAHSLIRDNRLDDYMSLLVAHFNPRTLPALMCRHLLSVDHAGRLYDCDFNQALGLDPPSGPLSIWDVDDLSALEGRPVATAAHCFGCTAGAGSSCGGTLTGADGSPTARSRGEA